MEEMSKACRELNNDLCDHYYEDTQAVEQQELEMEYSEKIEEVLEESARQLAFGEDDCHIPKDRQKSGRRREIERGVRIRQGTDRGPKRSTHSRHRENGSGVGESR